jgi:mono/diheme cytochrome c family protein
LASASALVLIVAVTTVLVTRLPAPRPVRAEETPSLDGAIERGRLVYERYGCALCHGGDGGGGVANPNAASDGVVPPVIYAKEGYSANELRRLIATGTWQIGQSDESGPLPPYRMPGWGDRMSPQEIGDLVEYLFSLYSEAEETSLR